MARLVDICLVLALFFVRFSLQQTIMVNIKPNRTTFYFELGKNPRENITCCSNCSMPWKCKYAWFLYDNGNPTKLFTEGKILLLNLTVKRIYTFKCSVRRPQNPTKDYGHSNEITVIIKENIPTTPTTNRVSVYSHSTTAAKHVKNDESLLNDDNFVVIGISGAAAVLLIAAVVFVGILYVRRKQRQNKIRKQSRRNNTTQKKDHGLEMTENTLYITAGNVTEMAPSIPTQNNAPTTGNGNDVYAVVDKTRKIEIPVYAEVRNSQQNNENTEMKKKPSGKEKNKTGKKVNKDGMVYVEIDFKDMPSNGKPVMKGAENKTLYVDIDSIKQTNPLPRTNEKETHDSQQNGKESQTK